MIYQERVRSKKINDPLFSSIKKYLAGRLEQIISEGDEEKIALARQRYEGLKHHEVQIEPSVSFENGIKRSCFVSRTRGFFHADAIIGEVTFSDILSDFNVKPLAEYTEIELKDAIKTQDVSVGLYQLTDTVEQVLVLDSGNKTIDAVYQLLGKIHWYEMTLTIPDSKDPVTERSGDVLIKSLNMDNKVVPIYYKPHLQE